MKGIVRKLKFRSRQIAPRLIAAVVLVVSLTAAAQQQNRSGTDRDFRPVKVVPSQKPITDPPVIAAENVRDQVIGNELVLGVEVNGQARAYPINMLVGPKREIINDSLGDVPIAATW